MAVLGYRLYSYEVFTKAISKQNRALNGKDSSQIELCDWVRFFYLTNVVHSQLFDHFTVQDIPTIYCAVWTFSSG